MSENSKTKPLIAAIDDEQMNIELLRFIIEKTNFNYIGIQKSQEAVAFLLNHIPDLILLDVMMPHINGYDLCISIKKQQKLKHIPIIFITGMDKIENKIKGFDVGGVDYVTKPFNEHELLARIKTHIALIEAKNKVEKLARDLKNDNLLKNRMFSIIGHDLRSPLSAIKLQLDFILRGIINHRDDDFIDNTVHNLNATTDEAFNLLDNLLSWAKSESGVLSIIKEELDINQLVGQNIRLQQMAAQTKNITISTAIPENALVYADMNMTKTVLRNLLSNAIKFTPKNGSIQISTEPFSSKWKISIKDSGRGINDADLKKILNPKEHFSKEGTENEAGTGLGLALCIDFIEKNNSELTVKSELGKGSTFSFHLPAAQKN
ncbi:MAG: hybrid sensor histidine kinase/response regulator [Cellulophaga sp.]